jgi:intracellular multiplication protein IcmT
MSIDLSNVHWRNTARSVRFFAFDARAAAPLLVTILHTRIWTLVLSIIIILFFVLLERFGLTLNIAMRRFRLWLTGPYRPATVKLFRRDFIDRGSA